MITPILHPEEIALNTVKDGIEKGYLAEDIADLVSEALQVDPEVAQSYIQNMLTKKLIHKLIIKDDMMGKVLFYSNFKPELPKIKRYGSMLIPLDYMTGQDVRQCTGIKTFSKAKPPNVVVPPKVRERWVVAATSNVGKKVLKKAAVEPPMVRTIAPVMKRTSIVMIRTKFPVKITRTK
jgi:hypothetical protein